MRHSTLLLSIGLSTMCLGQTSTFPSANATWVQYYEVMITPPPIPQFAWISTANFCMGVNDTLIDGVGYSQLHYCGDDYVGGIREDELAVYFYPADSTQEYLLYDFGAAVGDTLRDIYVNEPLGLGGASGWVGTRTFDVVVQESAPHADYDGRIRVVVQTIDPFLGMSSEWIEGIGCVHGLFTFNPINISEYWFGLECMSHNGTQLWNGWYAGTDGTCAPIILDVSEPAYNDRSVHPNPTAGIARLEGKDLPGTVVVRDNIGRPVVVPMVRTANERLELDFSAMPSGLYLISDASGNMTVRVMRE